MGRTQNSVAIGIFHVLLSGQAQAPRPFSTFHTNGIKHDNQATNAKKHVCRRHPRRRSHKDEKRERWHEDEPIRRQHAHPVRAHLTGRNQDGWDDLCKYHSVEPAAKSTVAAAATAMIVPGAHQSRLADTAAGLPLSKQLLMPLTDYWRAGAKMILRTSKKSG